MDSFLSASNEALYSKFTKLKEHIITLEGKHCELEKQTSALKEELETQTKKSQDLEAEMIVNNESLVEIEYNLEILKENIQKEIKLIVKLNKECLKKLTKIICLIQKYPN